MDRRAWLDYYSGGTVGILGNVVAEKLSLPLPISMAEISSAKGNRAEFASNDPPNLWVNRTALEKSAEKPLAETLVAKSLEKLEKAPLLPFEIRGRLLREVA